MGRQPSLEVKRHLTSTELRKLIKEEQKRGKVLQRLIFINDLYDGKRLAIPNHREIPKGTLRAIIRQAGLTVDELFLGIVI